MAQDNSETENSGGSRVVCEATRLGPFRPWIHDVGGEIEVKAIAVVDLQARPDQGVDTVCHKG